LAEKLPKVVRILRARPLAVAFSGGLDSGVLLGLAQMVLPRDKILGLTICSEIMPRDDLLWAKSWCLRLGLRHIEVPFEHLALEKFVQNSPRRCYFCKRAMYLRLKEVAREEGFFLLADGTIWDDLFEARPGLQACRELGVESPLAQAGLTKVEVKILGRNLGFPRRKFFPQACLATRFLPGERITQDALKRVIRAEEALKGLGFQVFRVRVRGEEAVLTLRPKEWPRFWAFRREIYRELKDLGFKKIFFDLEAYTR